MEVAGVKMVTKPAILQEAQNFSLVLGGPLYQLLRKTHLTESALDHLRRRIVVIAMITWLPLLLLSMFSGRAWGNAVTLPFLHDIETHVRFLVALPVLIAAELVVHQRIGPIVRQFVESGIISPRETPQFHAAINAAMRLRNSYLLEIGLIAVVYSVGLWTWRSQVALEAATWYATSDGAHLQLTPAGWWFVFVSLPIFQFMLLRWYLRMLIWFWFLWKTSRLNLRLTATHPDKTGGLAFMGNSAFAFAPVLFAQGAMLAGLIASRIFQDGKKLTDFKLDIGGMIVLFLLFVLGPLLVFSPKLARTKRDGRRQYGILAARYVQAFEAKWIEGGAPADEPLIGSADIQSLADLGNSYSVVREMRSVPFGLDAVLRLAVATAAPLLPLGLTMMPLEELITRLVQIVF